MKSKIYLRKNRVNSHGENPLYLKITQQGKTKVFSLEIWVKEKLFNPKTQRVKANSTDLKYMDKNKKIAYYEKKAKTIIDESFFKDETLSFDEFSTKFKNDLFSTQNFYEYVLNKLQQRLDNNEINLVTYKGSYRNFVFYQSYTIFRRLLYKMTAKRTMQLLPFLALQFQHLF